MAASQPIERRAEYIIRAKCNRRIEREDQDEYSYIWEELNACAPFGSMQIQTPRRPNRPSRKATLTIKAKEITLVGRQGNTKKPLTLHAVYAKETHPPKGKKGIEWMLLTSLPVENLNAAQSCEIIYEKKEWQTIYMMHQKKKPPKEPPVLQEMTRMLAQLGGFLARKHDGEPGAKTIWLGYQKLIHYVDALETAARC